MNVRGPREKQKKENSNELTNKMNSEERKREREKENRREDVKGRFEDSRLLIEKEFNMATRIRVKKKKTPVKKVDIMPRYTWRELNSEGREHNESRRLVQK